MLIRQYALILLELSALQKKLLIGSNKYLFITNIYRIQAYDLKLYGYFCIGFIDFMRNGKSLTAFKIVFSSRQGLK